MITLRRVAPITALVASALVGIATGPATADNGHAGHISGTHEFVDSHGHVQANPIEAFPIKNAAAGGAVISGNITYRSGAPVMVSPKVYVIWYGSWASTACTDTDTSTPGLVRNFLTGIGATPWYDINRTYYQTIGGVTTYVNSTVNYAGCTLIPSSTYGTALGTNASNGVDAIVSNAISNSALPADANAIYFVLTSPGISETSGGSSFLSQYCGYHSYLTVNGITPKYSFVGDATGPSLGGCAGQTASSPNGNPGGDALISVLAHELVEAVSDPMLNAWYDAGGNENADKCAWTFGTQSTAGNGSKYNMTANGVQFLVQQNWDASAQGCGMAPIVMATFTPGTPTISGNAQVGSTLTASAGSWTPAGTYTYQWLRNGTNISRATAATYALVAADLNTNISVRVTATKTGYTTASATSGTVGPVAAQPAVSTGIVTISGTPTDGQVLTASAGTWGPSPVTLTYQWLRAGANISGATAATYTLTGSDIGRAISVKVTGAKTGYTSASVTSAATTAVAAGSFSGPTPTITGTTTVGSRLTAVPGSWTPSTGTTLTYQWKRNGTNISRATSSTYTLVTADRGTTITVTVTGARTGYASIAKTSSGVGPIV